MSMDSTAVVTYGVGAAFPTSGGTATTLNYYEEGTTTIQAVFTGNNCGTIAATTIKWVRVGKAVTIRFGATTCTVTASNSGSFTFTGFPARLDPTLTTGTFMNLLAQVDLVGAASIGVFQWQSSGWTVYATPAGASFTTGAAGWNGDVTLQYNVV
jgi:hypothetical protein